MRRAQRDSRKATLQVTREAPDLQRGPAAHGSCFSFRATSGIRGSALWPVVAALCPIRAVAALGFSPACECGARSRAGKGPPRPPGCPAGRPAARAAPYLHVPGESRRGGRRRGAAVAARSRTRRRRARARAGRRRRASAFKFRRRSKQTLSLLGRDRRAGDSVHLPKQGVRGPPARPAPLARPGVRGVGRPPPSRVHPPCLGLRALLSSQ